MAKGKFKGTPDADDFVELLGTALKIWKDAKADGKIDISDLMGTVTLIPKVTKAFIDGDKALPELLDADIEEGKAFIDKIAAVAGPGAEKWVSIAGDVVQIVMLGISIKKTFSGEAETETKEAATEA